MTPRRIRRLLPSAPETAAAFFRALRGGRWVEASQLATTASLVTFRRRKLKVGRELSRRDAQFGGSVVSIWLHEFYGVRTIGQLRALGPADLLTRWWRARSAGERAIVRDVVGVVGDGPHVAYVVYRASSPASLPARREAPTLRVLTLARAADRWKIDVGQVTSADVFAIFGPVPKLATPEESRPNKALDPARPPQPRSTARHSERPRRSTPGR